MPLRWLFGWIDRTHFLLPGGLVALLGGTVFAVATGTPGGFVRAELDPRQIVGTLCLFVLLPAYVLALMPVMRNVTLARIEELAKQERREEGAYNPHDLK